VGRSTGRNAVQDSTGSQVLDLRMEMKAAQFVINTNQPITLTLCLKCAKSRTINVPVLVPKVFRYDNFHSCPPNSD